MNKAWITVEDNSLINRFKGVSQEVIDNFPNSDIKVNESNSSYFVLELLYDSLEEVKEVASLTTYLLLNAYVTEFTMTVNTSDLI